MQFLQLGSHDHNRVASRMGKKKIDGLMVLTQTLPGISFTYYGDEIGMEDHTEISWTDTVDVQACNADETTYQPLSRDVARTPFQWDDTVNAGFTSGNSPWLPLHPSYGENNLQAQMNANASHYKLYKELLALRKNETFINGDFNLATLNDNVLSFSRSLDEISFIIVINLGDKEETVDASVSLKIPSENSQIKVVSSNSNYTVG